METIGQTNLKNARICEITKKHCSEEDLGICLSVRPFVERRFGRRFGSSVNNNSNFNRLPEITIIPHYVSRNAFNEGINAQQMGSRSYILKFPEGNATHWLPLYLHSGKDAEHWIRTDSANGGTRKIIQEDEPKEEKNNKSPLSMDDDTSKYYHVLLDYSGSMCDSYINQSVDSLMDIAENSFRDQDTVSFSTFNSEVVNIFSNWNKKNNPEMLETLNKARHPNGSTAFYLALNSTMNYVRDGSVIIALTDGQDTKDFQKIQYNETKVKLQRAKEQGMKMRLIVITVGTIGNQEEISALIDAAPEGSRLIKTTGSTEGIRNAYNQVKKLIVGKSGKVDKDVLGASEYIQSAFSLIVNGENGHFSDQDVWRVCARILNLCVVGFSRDSSDLNENSMSIYCDIHRTLYEMLKSLPNVLEDIKSKILKFIDKSNPNNRSRRVLPDIGEAIQLLALVDDISWKEFGPIYIQEMFRRQAIRIKTLDKDDTRSDDEKVRYYWEQFKVSMILTIFNVHFVKDIVHKNNRGLKKACTFYEKTMRYIGSEELNEFAEKITYIHSIDNFNDAMSFLGLHNSNQEILELINHGLSYVNEPQPISGNYVGTGSSYSIRNRDTLLKNKIFSTQVGSVGARSDEIKLHNHSGYSRVDPRLAKYVSGYSSYKEQHGTADGSQSIKTPTRKRGLAIDTRASTLSTQINGHTSVDSTPYISPPPSSPVVPEKRIRAALRTTVSYASIALMNQDPDYAKKNQHIISENRDDSIVAVTEDKTSQGAKFSEIWSVGWMVNLKDSPAFDTLKKTFGARRLKYNLYIPVINSDAKDPDNGQKLKECAKKIEGTKLDNVKLLGFYDDKTDILYEVEVQGRKHKLVGTFLKNGVTPRILKEKAQSGTFGKFTKLELTLQCDGKVIYE
jgi:hypothetical protein